MRLIISVIFFILLFFSTNAQDSLQKKNSLSSFVKQSKISLKNRTFYMRTQNEKELKSDDALASGLTLSFETPRIKGFKIGLSGMLTYKIFSSSLNTTDSKTSQPNRYEIGLFDINNWNNSYNLFRIENMFLNYQFNKNEFSLGRVKLNTPFLNPQDGRMNATMEEGISVQSKEFKKLTIDLGYYWKISPRSTTHWYSIENSIGLYPQGVNVFGQKSNYLNHLNSSGILLTNLKYDINNNTKLNLHNLLVTNILNTSLIELNSKLKENYFLNLMYIHQNTINKGGNDNYAFSYCNPSEQSNAISSQIGMNKNKFTHTLSHTFITGDGRYLIPREWGRDPFYTFMPRERNEGFGNVKALVVKTNYNNQNFKSGISYGYFKLPDVKNFRLNKYGMPSYHQINLEAAYNFNKILKGLNTKLIIAYKIKQGNTYYNLKYEYNKVNMANINFVLDFNIF